MNRFQPAETIALPPQKSTDIDALLASLLTNSEEEELVNPIKMKKSAKPIKKLTMPTPKHELFQLLCTKHTFIGFSGTLHMVKDKKDRYVKKPGNPIGWQKITKTTIKTQDNAFCILTGKISNLTVIDFDSINAYKEFFSCFPAYKNCLQTKTLNGRHLYVKYTPRLKTTTDTKRKVDIRNDAAYVYAPFTSYFHPEIKSDFIYQFIDPDAPIMELHEDAILYLLQKKTPEPETQDPQLEDFIQIKEENQSTCDFTEEEIIQEDPHYLDPEKTAKIKSYIDLLPIQFAQNYDSWLRAGILIHNELGKKGLQVWMDFSRQAGSGYENEPDSTYEAKWRTFKCDGALKFPSLVKWVKEHNFAGYQRLQENLTYKQLKETFELTHCKIINKALYIKETEFEILFFNEKTLKEAYRHVNFMKEGKTISFIDTWINDGSLRYYDDINTVPPPKKCPDNIYNLWIPFAVELYHGDYVPNEPALREILNHIKIIAGHDEGVYKWMIRWIAHLFKYPAIKPGVGPIFTGAHGCGKNFITSLMEALMGAKKVLSTDDPGRDVWGHFNDPLAGAFFVSFEEVDQLKAKYTDLGKIKNFYTNPRIQINKKGVGAYSMDSFHRGIGYSNKNDPFPFEEGERRFFTQLSSNEKVGDVEYFNRLYGYLKDVDIIRTVYDFFIDQPVDEKMDAIPTVAYHEILKESHRPIIDKWAEDYCMTHPTGGDVRETNDDLFAHYLDWIKRNNYKYDTNHDVFNRDLTTAKIPGFGKTKTIKFSGKVRKGREINITKTREYYSKKCHFNNNDE